MIPNRPLRSVNPLPPGWEWIDEDTAYQAMHTATGVVTQSSLVVSEVAADAATLHATQVAAGDFFEAPAEAPTGEAPAAEVVTIDVDAPAALPIVQARPVPAEVVARERVAARGLDAYDAESGEWVTVSPEMVSTELRMREAFGLGKLMQAVVIREIQDQRLYLASGSENLTEYAENVLGISKSAAYDLYRVGKRYGALLPGVDFKQIGEAPIFHAGGKMEDGQDAEDSGLSGVGFRNLVELTRIGDDLDTLLDGASIELADGRTVSLDTLRRASAREAKEQIAALKREYRSRLQRDQERAELAEAERDIYRERADKLAADNELLRDGERTWGPRQMHAEGQMRLMDSASGHLRLFAMVLEQLNIGDAYEVPEQLATEAGHLLQRLDNLHHNAREILAPLTARL